MQVRTGPILLSKTVLKTAVCSGYRMTFAGNQAGAEMKVCSSSLDFIVLDDAVLSAGREQPLMVPLVYGHGGVLIPSVRRRYVLSGAIVLL